MSAGRVTTGGVVSPPCDWLTTIVKLAEPVLPWASVAEHVTRVEPIGNAVPDAGVHVAVTEPSTRSLALAVNVSTLPPGLVAESTRSAGTVTVGGVVSRTVALNEAADLLPLASDAVHETVEVPRANVVPEAGVQLTVGDGSRLSV